MADDPNTLMLFVRLALSLGMVLALVGGATWVLRRRGLLRPGGVAPSGRLEVLDRKSVGKNASIVLARVGDQAMLLGVTGEHIELLSDREGLDAAWRDEPTTAITTTTTNAPADTAVPITPRTAAHTRPTRPMTGGARRTGRPVTAPAVDRTRMSFIEALQELTVRRS